MSRCYVTGIAGFLGSHLADHLLAQGHDVTGCDNLLTGDVDNLPKTVKISNWPYPWQMDIEDFSSKFNPLQGIDVVYHCAALAYEGVSSFSPTLISRNIYAGSAAVFSAAIVAAVKRIVFCSSMARYGENHPPRYDPASPSKVSWDAPFDESVLPKPLDPYGIAKEAAERLLINLCETHGVEWSIAVPHNIYGPRQAIDPYRNVATIFANRMFLGEQPIIYGDGHQVRCFSYIDDVVPVLARMGFDAEAVGEVINVGPDIGEITILGLARMLADIVGVDCDPIFLPPRPREVRRALCSADKARRLFGFEQKTELREGLAKLVEWFRAKGPRPFKYHLPIEIDSPLTPRTWTERTM